MANRRARQPATRNRPTRRSPGESGHRRSEGIQAPDPATRCRTIKGVRAIGEWAHAKRDAITTQPLQPLHSPITAIHHPFPSRAPSPVTSCPSEQPARQQRQRPHQLAPEAEASEPNAIRFPHPFAVPGPRHTLTRRSAPFSTLLASMLIACLMLGDGPGADGWVRGLELSPRREKVRGTGLERW
ncbi:hypothetical protein EJ06DRAFT_207958 [Trichodelitschia bisporula]|uniref:Uncharacterized protein n=1 Tax=Trichodelitschia bisporula TaxID=703511 RepID=A0A6G1I897_9PEZI|nr:hypothetical protein EJ06DRAFT_207958 [Trichodelitschia bisporula]